MRQTNTFKTRDVVSYLYNSVAVLLAVTVIKVSSSSHFLSVFRFIFEKCGIAQTGDENDGFGELNHTTGLSGSKSSQYMKRAFTMAMNNIETMKAWKRFATAVSDAS